MNGRTAGAGFLTLASVFLAACSGGVPEPSKEKAPSDVPSGTIVFRRFTNPEQTQAAPFTMSTGGKAEKQLTKPPEGTIDSFPDWSPDGQQVVFHREFSDKPYEIHMVNADGSGEHQVDPGHPPKIPKDQINDVSEPAWSPDGKSIAYSWAYGELRTVRGEEAIDVVGIGVMAADGTDATQITQSERPTSSEDKSAIWSPDGRQIAFVRLNITDKPFDATAIFVANADGTNEEQITAWKLNAQDPAWSPDGELISFRSETEGEDFVGDIHTVHPDGSDITRLTQAKGKQVFASSFSPDSEWVVFAMTGVDNLPDLFLMRRDGSDVTPLTKTSTWESAPDWSPTD